jgi:hypothetical protein
MATKKPTEPSPYAKGTEVPIDRTKAEIEKLLVRHGATMFGTGWEGRRNLITFRLRDRAIRMTVTTPSPDEYARDATGRRNPQAKREQMADAEGRRRWRSLLLLLKAKLEAVASGDVSLEEEFLPYVVLPSGQTWAEWAAPQIARLAETGKMPELLPGLPPAKGER